MTDLESVRWDPCLGSVSASIGERPKICGSTCPPRRGKRKSGDLQWGNGKSVDHGGRQGVGRVVLSGTRVATREAEI